MSLPKIWGKQQSDDYTHFVAEETESWLTVLPKEMKCWVFGSIGSRDEPKMIALASYNLLEYSRGEGLFVLFCFICFCFCYPHGFGRSWENTFISGAFVSSFGFIKLLASNCYSKRGLALEEIFAVLLPGNLWTCEIEGMLGMISYS